MSARSDLIEEFVTKLYPAWQMANGNRKELYPEIMNTLVKRFDHRHFESRLLFGMTIELRDEKLLGSFTAVSLGVVLFVPVVWGHDTDFFGFMRELNSLDQNWYQLVPISKSEHYASLELRSSRRHDRETFPVVITEGWGSGHGASGAEYFITPSRWSELQVWLQKWLPKEK